MRRKITRALGALAWATVGFAVLSLAATFLPTLLGFQSMIVASGSMEPSMPVGSVALTRTIDAHAVSTGDVVSFRRPGNGVTTTHRVVAVARQGSQVLSTTRSDADADKYRRYKAEQDKTKKSGNDAGGA